MRITSRLILILSIAFLIYSFYSVGYNKGGYESQTKYYGYIISQENKLNCNGIEDYYTGDFWLDYIKLNMIYHNKYNATIDGDILKEPYILLNESWKGDFDCEDFSYIVKCLAKMYDYKCDYYIKDYYYGLSDELTGHVGLECKINDSIEILN